MLNEIFHTKNVPDIYGWPLTLKPIVMHTSAMSQSMYRYSVCMYAFGGPSFIWPPYILSCMSLVVASRQQTVSYTGGEKERLLTHFLSSCIDRNITVVYVQAVVPEQGSHTH